MKAFLLLVSIISSMNTAVCRFKETTVLGGDIYQETGMFYFQRERGLRWDYEEPEKKTFWLKGDRVFEFYPDENRFREYRTRENFWKILQDPSLLKEITEEIVKKNDEIFVKMKGGEEVVLEIKNRRIRKISFEDTTIEFIRCNYGARISPSIWDIPETFSQQGRKK